MEERNKRKHEDKKFSIDAMKKLASKGIASEIKELYKKIKNKNRDRSQNNAREEESRDK